MTIVFRWAFISAAILLYPGQIQSHVLRDDFSGLCRVLPTTLFLASLGKQQWDFAVRSQTVSLPCLPLSPRPHGSCHTWSEGMASFLPLTPWLTASQIQEHLLFLKECPPLLPPQGLCTCRAVCLRHFLLLASGCLEFLLRQSLYSGVTSWMSPLTLLPSSALLFFLALLPVDTVWLIVSWVLSTIPRDKNSS